MRLGETLAEIESEGDVLPSTITAIRLLLLTGCRRDEILTLRWEHVDMERGVLVLPDSKTGAKTVPLGEAALDVLACAPHLRRNPYVCPGVKEGGRLVGLQKAWERIREKAGLEDVRVHDLRHSFASVGAGSGMGLPILGALLGHREAATTQRYAHLAADPLKEAANEITAKTGGKVVKLDNAR